MDAVLFGDAYEDSSDDVLLNEKGTTELDNQRVTTRRKCFITQIHVTVPAGETVDIDHISRSGGNASLYTGAIEGSYFVGEQLLLHPGESLQFQTGNVQSGAREIVVKAVVVDRRA